MNINGSPIMDMSMNPNGYHQQNYISASMMPPPPPQHMNETGNLIVQSHQNSVPTSSANTNSNQGSNSGGEGSSGMQGGSGSEAGDKKNNQKKSWPKKKVYKKPDPNAPKQRRFSGKKKFSGYYVYMRERRDQLRSLYPEMPFYEIIRQLAQEWNNMDRDTKQKYLDSAEADKQNYEREMSQYKNNDKSYKTVKQRKKKVQGSSFSIGGGHIGMGAISGNTMAIMNRTSHINHQETTGMEIPIFTEDFLEHNKARELELRALRKTVTECEEQNAQLTKHIEQMQQEIERMEHEMRQQKLQNEMLSQNLNRLRSVLASSFASLPLPGTHDSPNIHTIDKYMNEVKNMQEANSVHFAPFLTRVKTILDRLDDDTHILRN